MLYVFSRIHPAGHPWAKYYSAEFILITNTGSIHSNIDGIVVKFKVYFLS